MPDESGYKIHPALDDKEEELTKANLPSEAITAFVVLLDPKDGMWKANSRVDLMPKVDVRREADMNDFLHGAQAVATDADTMRLTSSVIESFLRNMAIMQARAAEQAQMSQVTNLLRPKGSR